VKGKIYFAAGAVVGLLTGSRIGRGLYDRAAKAAGVVAGNTTVRHGVAAAGGRAADAAKSAGGGVGHKVTELRRHVADRHAGDEDLDGDGAVGGSSAGDHRMDKMVPNRTGAVNGTVGSAGGPPMY